jgi:hypothetical protein
VAVPNAFGIDREQDKAVTLQQRGGFCFMRFEGDGQEGGSDSNDGRAQASRLIGLFGFSRGALLIKPRD